MSARSVARLWLYAGAAYARHTYDLTREEMATQLADAISAPLLALAETNPHLAQIVALLGIYTMLYWQFDRAINRSGGKWSWSA